MPIFARKKASEQNRLLEHKLYLAKERPDEFFDLSACGLKEVPEGTYAFVKVLRKTHLLLQNNIIHNLNGGGKLGDLLLLQELDLSGNAIRSLPSELEFLTSLKVLLLSDNRLQIFPSPILKLTNLQTLNLENNQIRTIPTELGELTNLVQLYLDGNPITVLPSELSRLGKLQSITVPINSITSPPPDICSQGVQTILQYLGQSHVSNFQPNRSITVHTASTQLKLDPITSSPTDASPHTFSAVRHSSQRASAKELEQHLQEAQQANLALTQRAQETRKRVLNQVTEEDAQLYADLNAVQQRRDRERAEFLSSLLDAEQSASQLVRQLLMERAKAQHLEAAEDLANQRLLNKPDASFRLRRDEMLAEMKQMLEREDEAYHSHALQRDTVTQSACLMDTADSAHVDRVLARRYEDQKKLSEQLVSKEEAQREAFAKLFAQRDGQAQRLKREIGLIEQELCRLTVAEQDRKAKLTEMNELTLFERRKELVELLMQLNRDQQKRQKELQQCLLEMEERKHKDQLDYWLIQYQRVLDTKPPELMDEVEDEVWHLLKVANALDYLPNFRLHRITGSQLDQLTEEQLQRIGVHALGTRLAILNHLNGSAEGFKSMQKWKPMKEPSAPPPESTVDETRVLPSAPSNLTAHVETECCICQNGICSIVFLQCAHVCTCGDCARRITNCPLCRAPILQRIQLQYN